MAEKILIVGTGATAKTRHPVAVGVLVLVTLNIYLVFWWYFANRELADYGRAKGTNELGDSPAKSTLALFPGGLLIVPAIWTVITTFKRVQAAQRLTGETPLNGWIGLLLYVLITPAYPAYMQRAASTASGAARHPSPRKSGCTRSFCSGRGGPGRPVTRPASRG
jgi:hypothetical protein